MNINKNNYEAFFLDYHEGNLSPQEVAELLLFVEQHPELREEFEDFENITLYDLSSVIFEDKSDLKKKITEENCESYFIRFIEGDLNTAEEKLLQDFIEQHPHYKADLELFRKTILIADTALTYENKEALRRSVVTTDVDEHLISSVEGLLSKEEELMLKKQLAGNTELASEYALYQQTKVKADTSIVYENKEELKRNERKVIPIFWYVSGIAAAILILFGLFFLFNNGNKPTEQNFADTKNQDTRIKDQDPGIVPNAVVVPRNNSVAVNDGIRHQEPGIRNGDKNKRPFNNQPPAFSNKEDHAATNLADNQNPETNKPGNEQPELNEEKTPVVADNLKPGTTPGNNEQPAIAFNDSRPKNASDDYLTLRQFAAEKIKEKTLDENSVAQQKQTGRLRRFSGWDVAQIITRGVSKLTGRDVEVKPKYNDEGVVTAYALGNAFEVTRGK